MTLRKFAIILAAVLLCVGGAALMVYGICSHFG
jgi:hypothetical protein